MLEDVSQNSASGHLHILLCIGIRNLSSDEHYYVGAAMKHLDRPTSPKEQ